jgi:hypothetical protein
MNYFNRLKKVNGKLVHVKDVNKKIYQSFIDSLPEGAIVEFFIELQSENGNLAQLAKIHAMIRALSNHSGLTFEEMKLLVKNQAGMCYTSLDSNGKETFVCKSFKECSSADLNLAIQAAQEIGQKINFLVS